MTQNSNQTFSLRRFMRYARAHMSERRRAYFWHFAVISMIYFVILLMFLPDDEPRYEIHTQMFFYYAGLIITGGVFALRYHSSLARPESALINLMQPVSAFEKWLLAITITIVVYPITYTLIYFIMTSPVVWLGQYLIESSEASNSYRLFVPLSHLEYRYNSIRVVDQLPFWLIYTSLCGYALTTSVLFKRLPVIKSIALGFGIFLLFLLTMISTAPDADVLYYLFDRRQSDFGALGYFVSGLMWIVTPLLLLAASFRALKERDLV